jgi:hypothetical protein
MNEPSQATFGSAMVRWSCLVLLPFLGGCDSNAVDTPERVAPAAFAIRGRQANPLTLTYAIAGNGEPEADRRLLAAIEAAAATWSESELVQFRAAREDEIPTVTFSWERGEHGECSPFGIDGSIAHTGPMSDAMFTHLDAGRTWGPDGDSMFVATLHELGHVLGLGHSMDAESVMARDERHATIQWMDWAGLHSLYGGDSDVAGSLRLQRQQANGTWTTSCTLEGVAPAGITAWSLFDTDADGDDEVLVWRTDGVGHDDLMIYSFEGSSDGQGPRLLETRGPYLNLMRGGEVFLEDMGEDRRFLIVRELGADLASIRVRQFEASGGLTKATPDVVLALQKAHANHDTPPVRRHEGDLDGDGLIDRVQ